MGINGQLAGGPCAGGSVRGRPNEMRSQMGMWHGGMCYTRAGDADLLRRGHWLGCFSIEDERGVVGVCEGEVVISTGSYYGKACKATFLLLLLLLLPFAAALTRCCVSFLAPRSSHPMSRVCLPT